LAGVGWNFVLLARHGDYLGDSLKESKRLRTTSGHDPWLLLSMTSGRRRRVDSAGIFVAMAPLLSGALPGEVPGDRGRLRAGASISGAGPDVAFRPAHMIRIVSLALHPRQGRAYEQLLI